MAVYHRAPTKSNQRCVHRATLHSVALRCIAFGRPRFGSVDKPLHHVGLGHVAICAPTNRHPLGVLFSFMDQDLRRHLMPRPKLGRSRPTTAAAAPATFRLVHFQVVGREQMDVAADVGYCHGLEDAFEGVAHHIRCNTVSQAKCRKPGSCRALKLQPPSSIDR